MSFDSANYRLEVSSHNDEQTRQVTYLFGMRLQADAFSELHELSTQIDLGKVAEAVASYKSIGIDVVFDAATRAALAGRSRGAA